MSSRKLLSSGGVVLQGRPLLSALVFLIVWTGTLAVAHAEDVGRLLADAARAGDDARVIQLARTALAGGSDRLVVRSAQLLGGQAALRSGDADWGLATVAQGLARPPRDPVWAQAAVAYTRALIDRGFTFRAAQWAVDLSAVDPGAAATLLDALPRESLTDQELHYVAWMASTAASQGRLGGAGCEVLARLAEQARPRSLRGGDVVAAALEQCAGRPELRSRVQDFSPGAKPAALGFYDIAVIGPFNGRYARFGEALAQGAYLALEELNLDSPFPLRLQVFDSRGDPLLAAREAARAVQLGVGAILGDLLTPATIAVAAAAEAGGTPMVSPSATRSEIGQIGDHIFQTVVPREIQAQALARAAVSRLGIQRFAILHPDTAEGQRIADRFRVAVVQRGGEIVASSEYPKGQTNFAAQLDSLGGFTPELMIEAVFIPGTPRELMAVVPQFAYYEIDARVLSLEDLGLSEVLHATRDYLSEAVFADAFYRVPNRRLAAFRERYRAIYRRDPDSYATRGYVAMNVLGRAVQNSGRSREDVTLALRERVVEFEPGDRRGILLLGEREGQVALFEATGADIAPLE